MMTNIKKYISEILVITLLFAIAFVSKENVFAFSDPLIISANNITIGLRGTAEINIISGSKSGVIWSTSDADIVALKDSRGNKYFGGGYANTGVFAYGAGIGKATITAKTIDGATASCTVTVKERYIELELNDLTITDENGSGGYTKVKVTSGKAKKVVSSNEEIAVGKISNDNRNQMIVISRKREGNCIITVIGEDGAEATINVHVVYAFALSKSSLEIDCSYTDYWNNPGRIHNRFDAMSEFNSEYDIIAQTTRIGTVTSDDQNIVAVTPHEIYAHDDEDVYDVDDYEENPHYWTIKPRKAGTANLIIERPDLGIAKIIPVTVTENYAAGYIKAEAKKAAKNTSISIPNVYRTTRKIKVSGKKLHKGDVISIKIGSRSYKKRIKADRNKYTYTQKIVKPKVGSKIKITITNKYKDKVFSKSKKVYYAKKIKKGMTKKQCKYVPGWGSPDSTSVSGNITIWWYDDNDDGFAVDSYLEFKNGKLIGWHY